MSGDQEQEQPDEEEPKLINLDDVLIDKVITEEAEVDIDSEQDMTAFRLFENHKQVCANQDLK